MNPAESNDERNPPLALASRLDCVRTDEMMLQTGANVNVGRVTRRSLILTPGSPRMCRRRDNAVLSESAASRSELGQSRMPAAGLARSIRVRIPGGAHRVLRETAGRGSTWPGLLSASELGDGMVVSRRRGGLSGGPALSESFGPSDRFGGGMVRQRIERHASHHYPAQPCTFLTPPGYWPPSFSQSPA